MFTEPVLLLPPSFLPSAAYYAALMAAPRVVIDETMKYDKRAKSVHRTAIDTTHGVSTLTIPVERPDSSKTTWNRVNVSGHGEWWRTIKSTLATNFGPAPFFEYYRDLFDSELTESSVGNPVTSLDLALDAVIRRLLGLTTPVSSVPDSRDTSFIDMRRADFSGPTLHLPGAYIQLAPELKPGRSILDPLFRLGGDETRRLIEQSISRRQ